MKLQLPYKIGLFLLSFFLFIGSSYAQGFEDFTNSNAGGSYTTGSFIGNNGITWSYVASRDGNGDLNNSGIDLPALMLRRESDDSKITSDLIPNGISSFSVKLYKGFTGGGDRIVELFINGESKGVSIPFDDFDEHIFTVENIDVEGDFVLEIKNITEKQIIIDDIQWTAFDGGGINLPPSISQVTVTPTNITSSDTVEISAKISDSDGIESATLAWGTESGDLTNSIPMTLTANEIYTTTTSIPAQANGTTVYYEITAVDSSPESLSTTTDEDSYTVQDPEPFALPYSNGFRSASALNNAVQDGFSFENVNFETGGGGYLKLNSDSYIETPAINFGNHDRVFVQFDIASFGGVGGQGVKVMVSNDNGNTYIDLGSYFVEGSGTNYITYAQFVDLEDLNGINGRLKFELISGTGNNHLARFRDFHMKEFEGYSYNGSWSPSNPVGVSTNDDNIFVYSGNAVINGDLTAKNLYIGEDGIMSVQNVLNVSGNIMNDGLIKFLSTENGDGELGTLPNNAKVRGLAEVHRYMSAHRSFRMTSSAVTTANSIHDNWQEGATSNTDNPNDGFGTHITGTLEDQENGFDATASGNPSLFTLDIPTQDWVNIDNTDVNTLAAGEPYLLFVRGDRSIDLSSNASVGETVLRATGTLKTGNSTQIFQNVETNNFVMFGNPYQSSVDVTALFADSEKVISDYYYVYDPTLGDNGNYVTIDLTDGDGTNIVESDANKYLQPGQGAIFLVSEDGNAKINFKESHKAPNHHTVSNRNPSTASDKLVVQLFTEENLNTEGKKPHDSFGILFAEGYTNEFTTSDVLKYPGFYENLGLNLDGNILSVERRDMPEVGEIFHVYSSGYENTQYVFKMMTDGLEGYQFVLFDSYTGTSTAIDNGTAYYSFEVDPDSELSMAEDRFSIIVENYLGVDTHMFTGVQLYPNPITNDSFVILAPNLNGQEAVISITDMLGRVVYEDTYNFSGATNTVKVGQEMTAGIYLVKLSVSGETHTFRVIKK